MTDDERQCKIVDVEPGTNAFVVNLRGRELFRISFPMSVIASFLVTTAGYVLRFQCRSSIREEKGNVCLVSLDGDIVWWAERPRWHDCYVALRVVDDEIVAYDGTYDCYIDLSTGKVKRSEFVK